MYVSRTQIVCNAKCYEHRNINLKISKNMISMAIDNVFMPSKNVREGITFSGVVIGERRNLLLFAGFIGIFCKH